MLVKGATGVCYRTEVDRDQILDKICCAIDNIDTQNAILMGHFNVKNINYTGPGSAPLFESESF